MRHKIDTFTDPATFNRCLEELMIMRRNRSLTNEFFGMAQYLEQTQKEALDKHREVWDSLFERFHEGGLGVLSHSERTEKLKEILQAVREFAIQTLHVDGEKLRSELMTAVFDQYLILLEHYGPIN
jgi:hypothetical protein